jgi:hypothetical protein
MRILLGCLCGVLLTICALIAAKPVESVSVRLQLVDRAAGKNVSGIVRVTTAGKAPAALPLPGLLDRLLGLKVPEHAAGWYVVSADGAKTLLPREKLTIEALSGVETSLTRETFDLAAKAPEQITLKLDYLWSDKTELVPGNTHLHLMKLTQEQAEDYLRQIPAADGLRVLFISYLERHKDDLGYITNRYLIGDLPQYRATGVLVNNGEEHRHNFTGYGQGYGHVMFLNIKKLVKPVSLGPGITGSGFDDRPLAPGIDEARSQGGTILWCHNTFGFEDVVSALAGRLHGLNVFDGSRTGTYEDNYYRYLNLGLRMPLSTGTDWFLYDFSRVHVQLPGEITIPAWLEGLKAGRNTVTNGPLLTLTVNGRKPGEVISLTEPATVRIEASAIGRNNFQQLRLIHNGKIVKTQTAQGKNPFRATLQHEVRLDQPAWFAVRIDSTAKNELDRPLYAHSSPVYIDFKGKRVFEIDAARGLLQQLEEATAASRDKGRFSAPDARGRILALYQATAQEIRQRIKRKADAVE